MSIELRFDTDGVDWEKACEIFERAPLGTREPEQIRNCFENSQCVCFAWDEETIVGMGRALSDLTMQSVVYDLCILPEYQGSGLGRQMMEAFMDKLGTTSVILFAVPGKEGFYAKFGFREMTTAMGCFTNPDSMHQKGYIK